MTMTQEQRGLIFFYLEEAWGAGIRFAATNPGATIGQEINAFVERATEIVGRIEKGDTAAAMAGLINASTAVAVYAMHGMGGLPDSHRKVLRELYEAVVTAQDVLR